MGVRSARADLAAWRALTDGAIVLFRHAYAPGVGDPPGFKVGDCASQRNLDARGRADAMRIGEAFRARGIIVGRVVASQWCRASETAERAFGRPPEPVEAFNSFFDTPGRRNAQTDAAKTFLQSWRGPGVLVVVTHQVNILGLTDLTVRDGEGVVLSSVEGKLVVRGRIRP